MKKLGILLALLLILPTALAITPNIYVVTSEIGEEIQENVEIVGEASNLELIELNLPLNIDNIRISFNANELECNLKEQLNHNLLTCPINSYTGTYFLRLTYTYPSITLDGEILFKTSHSPQAKDFMLIAKVSDKYQVRDNSFITPAPTSNYNELNKQVFVWKLSDTDAFEASIVAEQVKDNKDLILGILIIIAAASSIFLLLKLKKKKITPKFIDSEQKIVDALKQQKKPIKQKDLQKLTDFSKARLSRLLKNLEKREVIKTTPWGRTKLIELKKK